MQLMMASLEIPTSPNVALSFNCFWEYTNLISCPLPRPIIDDIFRFSCATVIVLVTEILTVLPVRSLAKISKAAFLSLGERLREGAGSSPSLLVESSNKPPPPMSSSSTSSASSMGLTLGASFFASFVMRCTVASELMS